MRADSLVLSPQAGALVLADRGVCCIDEFASIREADRATIHEAMEQQTLSVAKAGLVCKLSARATVIAVTNPRGKYDHNLDLSVNTSLPPPLLSRFDIVLVIEDKSDASWDRAVSSAVLDAALADGEGAMPVDTDDDSDNDGDSSTRCASGDRLCSASPSSPLRKKRRRAAQPQKHKGWSIEKLRKYIAYVKDALRPVLSDRAVRVLEAYYTMQRSQTGSARGRATIRMLESLVRLAQAHARLTCRNTVTREFRAQIV